MTVAVVVKVFDGIVIAADSATSLPLQNNQVQVYNNANKIFHLHRELSVAAMTWGLGNIGAASIATLTKDLRRRLMGHDPDYLDWKLDPNAYSIQAVVDRYLEMFHGELYEPEFRELAAGAAPALGMLIVGYSSGEKQAEAWEVMMNDATTAPTPSLLFDIPQYGWQSFAQPEATVRMFGGIDPTLAGQLEAAVDPALWASTIEPLIGQAGRQPVAIAMPFADAIALAKFLVEP